VRSWAALEVTFNDPATDELLQAAISDFQIAAIEETAPTTWRVFFQSADERARAAAAIASDFPDVSLTSVDVADEDWARRSQESLTPITVGRVTVAPPWNMTSPASSLPPLVIVIQPSMGFGTGHHATTRLCLAALQAIDLTERSVLDVGTGSGVLAIAAAALGAVAALGIDSDPDAIESATENLALNPAVGNVTFRVQDLAAAPLPPADVVTANLTGALLVREAAALARAVRPGGTLILSGLLAHERDAVLTAFAAAQLMSSAEEDGWIALRFEKR